ncbi:helicase HerA-like domain-containing protein [Butyrivibrio proteoclasticus]|uniref:helicase HerA-like domain-containing protein n=1 Tax=Butyrivibrio proteoclasticus TaxID=43305 RepID=UPI00047D6CF1|nr:helicase HerA-like domain-containing protein [Butyrivibrio proteoclasticus]
MLRDGKVWIANTENGENVFLLPKMANRHGLVAGATGTGKTITLKVLAESFSDMGVPVFLADVKGDLSGMVLEGADSEDMQKRIQKFGLAEAGFKYQKYPVTFWDIYGEKGIPLRTTISEMGPLLLSRILGLNDLQRDILSIAFKIADDNELLLVDTKDLKALLNYMSENSKEFAADYGNISKVSIAAIVRAVVSLEIAGGDKFFFEPALNIRDWFATGTDGKGMISILDSTSLINNGTLYATFLLWMMSELFETLPEVGDLDKPKMVFFFDEAHLLFKDTPKLLMDKIEQVVKLIRSKGVGIYFVTQNPRDIPDGVLAQLGNKIQHALHAYTPSDMKAVKAAADSFRENPAFKTADVIQELGVGEAVCSFLDESGTPTVCEKVKILPPQSLMGGIDDSVRDREIKGSVLYSKYFEPVDPDSAYEFLERKGIADAKAKEELEAKEKERKELEKKEAQEAKEKEKAKAAEDRKKKQAMKSVGNSVAGTVGREVGKTVGGTFGKFGKTLGGNLGASLGRGLLSTLFKS